MGKDRKKIAVREVPKGQKEAVITEKVGVHPQHPSWRLGRMEFCEPYGWHKCTAEELQQIRACLVDLETLTWGEILSKRSRLHHYCPTKRFSDDARQRLRKLKLDDLEEMLRLRVSSGQRLWGLLQTDGVFDVLWWDPNHEVYPWEPQNT